MVNLPLSRRSPDLLRLPAETPPIGMRTNALEDYAEAKNALNALHRELMDLNPSAARSLGEGLEETLTMHRLHVPPRLRKTLGSTNVIESAFSIVERVCANVKRWHTGDQRERWVGSGLLVSYTRAATFHGKSGDPASLLLQVLITRKYLAHRWNRKTRVKVELPLRDRLMWPSLLVFCS